MRCFMIRTGARPPSRAASASALTRPWYLGVAAVEDDLSTPASLARLGDLGADDGGALGLGLAGQSSPSVPWR